jgi:hypothetical protein
VDSVRRGRGLVKRGGAWFREDAQEGEGFGGKVVEKRVQGDVEGLGDR